MTYSNRNGITTNPDFEVPVIDFRCMHYFTLVRPLKAAILSSMDKNLDGINNFGNTVPKLFKNGPTLYNLSKLRESRDGIFSLMFKCNKRRIFKNLFKLITHAKIFVI